MTKKITKTSAEIFELLRDWRNSMALQEGKKPFMVLKNDVLKETAEHLPQNLNELESIKGWGPAKIAKYGNDIIEILTNPDSVKKEEKDFLTVGECILTLNQVLHTASPLKIKGEITDISGRQYYTFFTLKDSDGKDYAIQCFVGWQTMQVSEHLLKEGMEVIIFGDAKIYKNGRLSIDVDHIEPVGVGALQQAFEELKKELTKLGYFDLEKKIAIPANVQRIGLITSERGAAIKDFKENLGNFGFTVYSEDVYVEGDYAINSICQAITLFNKNKVQVDVIVLIRGGGSMESLKAFNSREIADAILLSKIPIITGVGHEQDVSIADYVADHSVSTPTAVANYLTKQKENLYLDLNTQTQSLFYLYQEILKQSNAEVEKFTDHLVLHYDRILSYHNTQLQQLTNALQYGLRSIFHTFHLIENRFNELIHKQVQKINHQRQAIRFAQQKIMHNLESTLSNQQQKISLADNALQNLNPENVLKRGYSIIFKNKKAITQKKQLSKNDAITIKLSDGSIDAKIK